MTTAKQNLPFNDVFTLERTFKAPVSKVYNAFKDFDLKCKWFVAPPGYELAERSLDFRVGGKEIMRGQFPSGKKTSYDATFYDIVENERIIYAYDLLINDERFSVTLATISFWEEGGQTHMTFTEQNAYVNAPENANASRMEGVSWHLDNLTKLF